MVRGERVFEVAVNRAENLSARNSSRARSKVTSVCTKVWRLGYFAVVLIFILVDIVRSASTWLSYEGRSIYK
jgi:hypothetical protein